jgi:CBS domain-containing protein
LRRRGDASCAILEGTTPGIDGSVPCYTKGPPGRPVAGSGDESQPNSNTNFIGGKGTTAVTGTVTKTGFRQWARRSIKAVVALGPKDPALLRRAGFIEEEIMQISNVMSRDVQIIDPDQTLRDAAAIMKRLDAGVLPVAEKDKLVGMITDRDIAIRGVAEGKGPTAKIRDVMSHEVKYCFEDEEVDHVAENMAELQVRRLPVMDRQKRLVGIVSLGDLATHGSLPKTARALHGISQPGGPHNQSEAARA